jgi:hypothetical protein
MAAGSAEAGTAMMANAIGLYLVSWFIFTFIMVSSLPIPTPRGYKSYAHHSIGFFSSCSSLHLSEARSVWSSSSSSWTLPSCCSLWPNSPTLLLFKRQVVLLVSSLPQLLGMSVLQASSLPTPATSPFPFSIW